MEVCFGMFDCDVVDKEYFFCVLMFFVSFLWKYLLWLYSGYGFIFYIKSLGDCFFISKVVVKFELV